MPSLLRRRLESVSRLLLAGRDVPVVVDVDVPFSLELEHQRLGLLEVDLHVLVVGELGLSILDVHDLGLEILLAEHVLLLLGLDLGLGPSPLRADLQHVGRLAFLDYRDKNVSEIRMLS